MVKAETLRSIPIFATLSDNHRALLASQLGSRSYSRGETIFNQGSGGSDLYIIVRGQVRIFTVNEAGQELSVTILRAGEFFGELALLDGQPRSASATAMQPTVTLILGQADFLEQVRGSPIAMAILTAQAVRLRSTTLNAEQLAGTPAMQRIIHQLLELAARYGIPDGDSVRIDLRLTQDDLASLSGTTRETVNRALAALREQGLISVARAQISLLNVSQLEAGM